MGLLGFDWTTVALFVFIFALSMKLYQHLVGGAHNIPPGPRGFPLVGYVPQLLKSIKDGSHPYNLYMELGEKYGPVFTVWLGPLPGIIVNGYDAVHEMFVKRDQDFMDRPGKFIFLLRELLGTDRGVVFHSYGQKWKNTRKFAMQSLRDFGVGKASLEDTIYEEAGYVISEFASQNQNPFNPRRHLKQAVSNIICSINFGNRFDYNDERFQSILDNNDAITSSPLLFAPENAYPILAKLPGSVHSTVIAAINNIRTTIQGIIDEHKSTFDADNIRDFVDYYLKEAKEREERKSNEPESAMSDNHLFQLLVDIFNAGTETTSTTLQWLLNYLINYPEIQKRVHEEIDRVVGDKRPTLKDRADLPFSEAVIHEVQRLANVVALCVPHTPLKETTFHGYTIPRKSMILANLWSVHHDEKYWPNPKKFDPDRWIGEDGKFVKKEAFIPFSEGRRVCLGQQLAQMELFVFFVTLLQRFRFQAPDGETPSLVATFGVSRAPKVFEMVAISRHS